MWFGIVRVILLQLNLHEAFQYSMRQKLSTSSVRISVHSEWRAGCAKGHNLRPGFGFRVLGFRIAHSV